MNKKTHGWLTGYKWPHEYPVYLRVLVNARVGKKATIYHNKSLGVFVISCGTQSATIDENIVMKSGREWVTKKAPYQWRQAWPALDKLRKQVGDKYE